MNLLYISKHGYIKDSDGNVFSVGMMGPDYFEKYLPYFDTVTVIGYVRGATAANLKKTVGNPIHDTDRIKFRLAPCGSGRFSSSFTNKAIKALAKECMKDADAVACKSASGASFAVKYAKKYKKPYMVEVVGCPWDAMINHSLIGKFLAPYEFLSLRHAVKQAPFVTYVTDKFLQGRYPTKGKSAGVSDVQLKVVDGSVLENRLIRQPAEKIKIGTAGALHVAYKGQHYVIEAMAKLKAEGNTRYEYHLAGGGDNAALKNLAEQLNVADQVVFEGSLPHDAMFDWLDSLDLYIQPSTVEGLPRALVEAMSRGLPAFASRVGGMPELLDEGTVFTKGDVEAIADKLRGFNPEAAREMAQRNFERAKDFQKEKLEKKRNDFYAAFAKTAEENCK